MATAGSGGHGTGEARGLRELGRIAGHVLALAWVAAPLVIVSTAALTVISGLLPAATAWMTRAVVNGLVSHTTAGRPAPGRLPHRLPHRLPASGAAVAVHRLPAVSGSHIVLLAAAIGALGLLAATLPHGRRYAEAELQRGLGLLTQDRMVAAVNRFPGLSRFESPVFFDKIRLAQQLSDTTAANLVSSGMACGQYLITAMAMFATLEWINPVLAAIVAATALPAVAAQIANSRRSADLEWRKSPALRRQLFYARLTTGQGAAQEVRLFGLGDFLRRRMLAEMRSINQGQRALDRRVLSVEGVLSLAGAVISAGALVWAAGQAVAGRLSVGDVSMVTMSVVGVQGAIAGLVTRLAEGYRSLLLFGHYDDVVSAGPDLTLADPPRPMPRLRDGIEVRDVWFRYDEQHPWVLQGVSLFVPHGQSVALIGLNGAGKSTLVKLLCRMYDPGRGSIRWDGVDIRDVAPAELRQRIGTVFQDYVCYDLTAAENIGLGDLGRLDDRDRICDAARQAGADGKLSALPRGYDTMLSRIFFDNADKDDPATGVVLSGGQWQRLALARGLMRVDRDLLILDEPSSGLDAAAEHAVHQRLCAARAGRTSLLISHRLGSVRDADVIFVLSAGRIIEQGSHADLMAAQGEYCRLFSLQASGYVRRGGPEANGSRPVGHIAGAGP